VSKLMDIYEPGDHLTTMSRAGQVTIWKVQPDGTLSKLTDEEAWRVVSEL
jgi:hypothetical protein